MQAIWKTTLTFLLIFSTLKAYSADQAQCKQALKKMGICLALQSDYYDEINLKDKYTAQSECIEGVGFHDGIVKEDANAMVKLYDLDIKTTEDPLGREASSGLFSNNANYCAGEISLKVANKKESVSVIFTVANTSKTSQIPEITIDL